MEFFEITNEPEGRYARHQLIDWWDQEKLKNAKILVAGAGALGNEVLKNLALVGVGNITIIDFDTISITNLTRSVLFRETDVGLPKVEMAKKRILEINPEISVTAIYGDLEFDIGVGEIAEYDIIIGCLDSINARWAINQIAYRSGIPWINAGIGVQEGEISFFEPKSDCACYECTISETMWQRRNLRYSCQGLKKDIPEASMPTTATISSVAAAMQVQQALLYLHGNDKLLKPGEKIFISLNPWTAFKVQIQLNENCLAHELLIAPKISFEYEAEKPVQEIITEIKEAGFTEPVLWLRHEIIAPMICDNCGYQEEKSVRLRQYSETQIPCPKCETERDFEVIRNITEKEPDLKLGDLCLNQNEILHCDTAQGRIAIKFYPI